MLSKTDRKKILDKLSENYLEIFYCLSTLSDNIKNRAEILKESKNEIEQKLEEMKVKIVQKYSTIPNFIPGYDKEISSLCKPIHYKIIEMIQRINILIELFAVYYNKTRIRENLSKLPEWLPFGQRELGKEFNNIKSQTFQEVRDSFKYPENLDKFIELKKEDRDIIENILEESLQIIMKDFKKITKFRDNFKDVYNNYKHTLSEETGSIGFDKNNNVIQSHIYITFNENGKICRYTVPTSLEEVRYYYEIGMRVGTLLFMLIDNNLLYIINEKRDFIPRCLHKDIKKESRDNYFNIIKKIKSCTIHIPHIRIKIKPPNQEEQDKMNQTLKENHIYKTYFKVEDIKKIVY